MGRPLYTIFRNIWKKIIYFMNRKAERLHVQLSEILLEAYNKR